MSGSIDEISEKLGRLASGVETLLEGQKRQEKETKRMNKSLITTQMQQSVMDRRLAKHEQDFRDFVEEEFAQLKEDVEDRLKPLEGLRRKLLWAWGMLGTGAAIIFTAAVGKVMGKF